MDDALTKLSKFMSYVLRHAPEDIGLTLGDGGWVATADLIAKAQAIGQPLTADRLHAVVAMNDKKRFTLSADGTKIRAAQGHSVEVSLGLKRTVPPHALYHGTAMRFLDAILAEGLKPGSRQQVHLSLDEETARRVGMRHGKPAILIVDASRMHREGVHFYEADNGIWLVDRVPPQYLSVKE
jgi:putative RNA 2'-phosphotransferase